jgi:hypothetical protein
MAPLRLATYAGGVLLLILFSLPLSLLNGIIQLTGSTQSMWVDKSSDNDLYRSSWEYATSLPLDVHGPMHQDILGIYHHPESAAITVVLQNGHYNSREACLRPYLVARLSGPAVGVVYEWSYRQSSSRTADRSGSNASTAIPATTVVMEGFYDVPATGVYFLEIVAVLCNTYDDDIMRKTEVYTYSDKINVTLAALAFEAQQQHVLNRCLVNPQNNKLTAFGTSIVVVKAATSLNQRQNPISVERIQVGRDEEAPKKRLRGFWVREVNRTEHGTEAYAPLYTRYQPPNCPPANCTHPAASETRFDPYKFSWTLSNVGDYFSTAEGQASREREASPTLPLHPVNEQILIDEVRVKSKKKINETFCILGDSHALQLKDLLPIFVSTPVVYAENRFAVTLGENITVGDSNKSIAVRAKQLLEEARGSWSGNVDCSVVVTQIAHWDASSRVVVPTPVAVYEHNMWRTVQNLQQTFPAARIFVWSPHSNSLGTMIWDKCPHEDWRNPALIDFYREALQRVVAKTAAASPSNPPVYLDTTFISKPMWDSAHDWRHFSGKVALAQTLFIAATILDVF